MNSDLIFLAGDYRIEQHQEAQLINLDKRWELNMKILEDDGNKYKHYHKKCPYDSIDVYRVLELFEVANPCLQHAIKKLLVAGGRGNKDINKDIQESIDTLERFKQMRIEDNQIGDIK